MAEELLSGNYTERDAVDIGILTMELTLGITGILGNLLVCVTIFGAKFLHSKTNYFITSLAVADLLVSLLAVIFNNDVMISIKRYLPENQISREIYCRFIVNKYIFWACALASTYNLVGVTLERFIAIAHPFKYSTFYTKRRLNLMFTVAWTSAIFVKSYLVCFTYYDDAQGICVYDFASEPLEIIVGIWALLMTYIIPLTLLVLMYLRIILLLRKTETNRSHVTRGKGNDISSAKRKLVKILLAVSILYAIFWTPAELIFLAAHFDIHLTGANATLKRIFFVFPLANSIVNPVIYCFKYKQFRKGVVLVFCRAKRKRKIDFNKNTRSRSREQRGACTLVGCHNLGYDCNANSHDLNQVIAKQTPPVTTGE